MSSCGLARAANQAARPRPEGTNTSSTPHPPWGPGWQASFEKKEAESSKALKETKGELQARLAEMEKLLREQREGKENGKKELEMVVQMHNKKYSEMLAQQLAEQARHVPTPACTPTPRARHQHHRSRCRRHR